MDTIPYIRIACRSFYDAQKIRIEMGNRITKSMAEMALTDEWVEKLTVRKREFEAVEKGLLKDIRGALKEVDIWPWLKAVKGCGPTMAGVIVSEIIDPGRFDTVSKLWAYSGLHVKDGAAVKRSRGEKANWNGFLKTKLVGVLGSCFIKSGSEYRDFYDNYKVRIANRPCWKPAAEHSKKETATPNGCTLGHMHSQANRYMVKMFLLDLHTEWRKLRGLPVREPYAEEYLKKVHSGGAACDMEPVEGLRAVGRLEPEGSVRCEPGLRGNPVHVCEPIVAWNPRDYCEPFDLGSPMESCEPWGDWNPRGGCEPSLGCNPLGCCEPRVVGNPIPECEPETLGIPQDLCEPGMRGNPLHVCEPPLLCNPYDSCEPGLPCNPNEGCEPNHAWNPSEPCAASRGGQCNPIGCCEPGMRGNPVHVCEPGVAWNPCDSCEPLGACNP